jgi:uncharacterized protein YjhX (UPF0386 family)
MRLVEIRDGWIVDDCTCERFRMKNKKTKKGDYRGVCKSR